MLLSLYPIIISVSSDTPEPDSVPCQLRKRRYLPLSFHTQPINSTAQAILGLIDVCVSNVEGPQNRPPFSCSPLENLRFETFLSFWTSMLPQHNRTIFQLLRTPLWIQHCMNISQQHLSWEHESCLCWFEIHILLKVEQY